MRGSGVLNENLTALLCLAIVILECIMNTVIAGATRRKIASRIVPVATLAFFIVFLARLNRGCAAVALNQYLGLLASVLGVGVGMCCLGYLFAPARAARRLPTNGPRIWLARIMVSWGLVVACMLYLKTAAACYLAHFLLGVAEAGVCFCIMLYLNAWFPGKRRAQVMGVCMAAAPLCAMLAAALVGAVLRRHSALGLAGGQQLLLLDAAAALLFGGLLLFYRHDSPEKATWLNEEQRYWLINTLKAEQASDSKGATSGVWAGQLPLRAWALIYFGTSMGLHALHLCSAEYAVW